MFTLLILKYLSLICVSFCVYFMCVPSVGMVYASNVKLRFFSTPCDDLHRETKNLATAQISHII